MASNIVLIVLDDASPKSCGFSGGTDVYTPNIDALAAASCQLTRFHTHPECTASRATLMTGLYAHMLGCSDDVFRPWTATGLPTTVNGTAIQTLADRLSAAGYQCELIGKWHLGHDTTAMFPTNRGFDYFYGLTIGSIDYNDQTRFGERNWFENTTASADTGYVTTMIGDKAVARINAHDFATPLFMQVNFTAPHTPLQALSADESEIETRFPSLTGDAKTFAAMMLSADREIGRIETALKDRSEWNDTLFVLCTDNGGDEDAAADNGALRGEKSQLYNGGLFGPCFISWPNGALPSSSDAPIHIIDLHRGALNHAGLTDAPSLGEDMIALIKGEKQRRFMLIHADGESCAFINGDADAQPGAVQVTRHSPENVKVVVNGLRTYDGTAGLTPEVYALTDTTEATDLWSGLSGSDQTAINNLITDIWAQRATPLMRRTDPSQSGSFTAPTNWAPA